MSSGFITYVASAVPFDADPNFFDADNVQEALEEIDFREIIREPTGFTDNAEATIDFNEGTRTFSITPVAADFTYCIWGKEFTKTSVDSIVIPDTNGVHIIYYDDVGTGNLVSYTGGPSADKPYDQHEIKVAVVYWNVALQEAVFFGDARTLLTMPWGVQRRSHFVTGSQITRAGFLTDDANVTLDGDGSLDAHAQYAFSTTGDVYHEDERWSIVSTATPSADFEQDLGPIAKIPIYYRTGAGNGVWQKSTADNFALIDDPGNTIFWNEDTGSTWQLTNAGEGNFVAVYMFATIDPREPVIGVLGDHSGGSPLDALHIHMKTPQGLPVPAMAFINALIFQTSSSYTNTPKARLVSVSPVIFADSIDRYAVLAFYNGQANDGRYLEMVPGIASDDLALLIPEDSFIRTVTVQAFANLAAGDQISFFEFADLVTPRITLTMAGGGLEEQFEVAEFFSKGEKVVVQVTAQSINKPAVRFWIETKP